MKKISFENVSKKFKQNFWEKESLILNDLSFELIEGDLIGFLGANGAGKTTSIKILLGFIKETKGFVHFEGFLNKNRDSFIQELGYLPEKTYIYQHLTGREFLNLVGKIFNIQKSDLDLRIKQWSEKLMIDYALDKVIKTYSKGMQQRLCFVSALLNQPKFLILDEPLSGLDPMGRKDFKQIFKDVNSQLGTTVFFSSHVVSDVEEICNKVLFIEKGKMIYQGSVDKLIHENATENFKISYFKDSILNTAFYLPEEKDKEIVKLIESGANIIKLEKNIPSLESIIYKVKPNEKN